MVENQNIMLSEYEYFEVKILQKHQNSVLPQDGAVCHFYLRLKFNSASFSRFALTVFLEQQRALKQNVF